MFITLQKTSSIWVLLKAWNIIFPKFKHLHYIITQRTSSTIHVKNIHRSSSECEQLPWLIVSAQIEHSGNISLEFLWYGRAGCYSFLVGRTLQLMTSSLSNQGDSLNPRAHSGDPMETCHTYKCMVQTYNVHIVDLLAFLDSVTCFASFGSTPVGGISNIYWRVFHIRVRVTLIF